MRHRVRPVVLLCAVAGTVALAACGAKTSSTSSSSGASTAAKGAKQGGSMTVVLNSGYDGAWPAGLDPVTNTNGAANQSLMNSIYGQLIELHEGGKLVPGLASAFKFSNGGKTFTLTIRPGVKFSDGTPFTAQVVADHINKVLKSSCTCRPTWPVPAMETEGRDSPASLAWSRAARDIARACSTHSRLSRRASAPTTECGSSRRGRESLHGRECPVAHGRRSRGSTAAFHRCGARWDPIVRRRMPGRRPERSGARGRHARVGRVWSSRGSMGAPRAA